MRWSARNVGRYLFGAAAIVVLGVLCLVGLVAGLTSPNPPSPPVVFTDPAAVADWSMPH